ncbi:hypothetical protein [Virgibacillus salexigens]|uniref:Uncharacterized protein n=2 Tax=Bacillaceae TaxID=186817 RepID=A0A024QCM6_9BACI|nr:hypothetical protein [Virgibacillus massiliensis]CDQ39977.1 hypothetical protein BN990_02295 [Virgibacillus massiliensis]
MDVSFFSSPLFWGVFVFKVFITYHKSFGNCKYTLVEEQILALFDKRVRVSNEFPQTVLKWISKLPYFIAVYPFQSWGLFLFMIIFSLLFQIVVVTPIFHNRIVSSDSLNQNIDIMLRKAVVENGLGNQEDINMGLLDKGLTKYKDYL